MLSWPVAPLSNAQGGCDRARSVRGAPLVLPELQRALPIATAADTLFEQPRRDGVSIEFRDEMAVTRGLPVGAPVGVSARGHEVEVMPAAVKLERARARSARSGTAGCRDFMQRGAVAKALGDPVVAPDARRNRQRVGPGSLPVAPSRSVITNPSKFQLTESCLSAGTLPNRCAA
jgi:hypothetical protein